MMTPPATLAPYLYSHGSLTALLEQRAGQAVRVSVMREGHQLIDFSTKKLLGLPIHRPTIAWCNCLAMMTKRGCVPKVCLP